MQSDNWEANWDAKAAEELADLERKAGPPPSLDRDVFIAWRSPRQVTDSPIPLDDPLWHWMVRTRHSGYAANETFRGQSPFEAGPMWCFDRFGESETTLPDDRVIHIGEEHEDYYDPDFFIYNDVTVINANGSVEITSTSTRRSRRWAPTRGRWRAEPDGSLCVPGDDAGTLPSTSRTSAHPLSQPAQGGYLGFKNGDDGTGTARS